MKMIRQGISIWGDSIAKGVIFDEARGRYSVYRDNCVLRLSRNADCEIENFSVMGNTSQQALNRMEGQHFSKGNYAVIEFGGNDCDLDWKATEEHPETPQFGRVPLESFSDNLRRMIARVRENDMIPVLVTPPPLVAQRYFDWVTKNLNPARVLKYLGDVEAIYRWQERYALMIRRVAAQERVKVLDVRDLFLSQRNFTDLMCVDGIHPNPTAHALMYDAFAGML